MLIRGVTRDDLMAAADVASMALGNELVVYDLRPANRSQTAWRLRLKVADLDKPGARLHLRDYYFGVTERPRRSRHACCHAHGAFYTAVFERNEHAVIETAHARYRGARDFLCAYPVVLDRNIGSMMFPIRFGDCCTCHSDLIETDSIEYVGYETFIPNGGARVKGG
jgi:hypothetical protein